MHPNANLVKVDLPSELFAPERLFATHLGGDYYRLESIPFRIPSISLVELERDDGDGVGNSAAARRPLKAR